MSSTPTQEVVYLTATEKVEVTVAKVLIFVIIWQMIEVTTKELPRNTRLIIYTIILVLALLVIIPVYRKNAA